MSNATVVGSILTRVLLFINIFISPTYIRPIMTYACVALVPRQRARR